MGFPNFATGPASRRMWLVFCTDRDNRASIIGSQPPIGLAACLSELTRVEPPQRGRVEIRCSKPVFPVRPRVDGSPCRTLIVHQFIDLIDRLGELVAYLEDLLHGNNLLTACQDQ